MGTEINKPDQTTHGVGVKSPTDRWRGADEKFIAVWNVTITQGYQGLVVNYSLSIGSASEILRLVNCTLL